MSRIDFFTSHEGMNLWYEQAQTRQVPRRSGWYNLSTHFPWIGDRTRSLDGAHIEYFRGIRNPVAVKIGPSTSPDELLDLTHILDPDNEPGHLTIIHRLGAKQIAQSLPPFIEAVKRAGKHVLWCCDPMHANTVSTKTGVKTRRFDDILQELDQALIIHRSMGSHLGGVHIELTGDNVTECIGGARGLAEEDLATAYKSQLDPRLNYEQAMEMALRVSATYARWDRASSFVAPTRLKHPVQDRLDLERLQIGLQRQDPRRDAGQVRRRPAGRRLVRERAQVAAAVRLKLHRARAVDTRTSAGRRTGPYRPK